MKHTFPLSLYDEIMALAREYKIKGDTYNFIWALSNAKIIFGRMPPLEKDDIFLITKEIVLLRDKKDYFQLSFFLSRLTLINPQLYTDYTEEDKAQFVVLLDHEKKQRQWGTYMRLCSRFSLFDRDLITITNEDVPCVTEILLDMKAEKLWWDFIMLESFAVMVNPTLAVDISKDEWKEIEVLFQGLYKKDIWAYCRMASWIVLIEKAMSA